MRVLSANSMIAWRDYEMAVSVVLNRDIRAKHNSSQNRAISSPGNRSLFIVAGPGSGKTTVIALRILKLIMVDGQPPDSILSTTFTRKAAAELRSRVLGWGDMLRRHFCEHRDYTASRSTLEQLDFNLVRSGTIDSIAEDLLSEYRTPGSASPSALEEFVAVGILLRVGLFKNGRFRDRNLKSYIASICGTSYGLNTPAITKTLKDIHDRLIQDDVSLQHFRRAQRHPGAVIACAAVADYRKELEDQSLFDFPALSRHFLTSLQSKLFDDYLNKLRFVLIDEYQDTNFLQEQTYFNLARPAVKRGGSITVVGDDDQSLYRFRGATVDLFRAFPSRVSRTLRLNPETIHLSYNYRSTPSIVKFVNSFVAIDRGYRKARVTAKPSISAARANNSSFVDFPVLGMFRPTVEQLGEDLASLIHSVVHGSGFSFRNKRKTYQISISNDGGSAADIALLTSTPREYSSAGKPRLPLLLRSELSSRNPPIKLFNPRGQSLADVPAVQLLCGMVLECIDPAAVVQNSLNTLPVGTELTNWRTLAINFVKRNPHPRTPLTLPSFTKAWAQRRGWPRNSRERQNVALNDLVYKLITWLPDLQDDIEQIVYLEAVARTIASSALFSNFASEIIFAPKRSPFTSIAAASIKEAIWNVFVPLATGVVDVNEDLLDTLPNDRMSVMSVHQAKGLEFPLVIVDVGSDFKSEHPSQAFKRFPRSGGVTCELEDRIRPLSPLRQSTRSGMDRAFDDLVRQYFVAFSRPQDVLILVGQNSVQDGVRNVGTGWDRTGKWRWQKGLTNLVHV